MIPFVVADVLWSNGDFGTGRDIWNAGCAVLAGCFLKACVPEVRHLHLGQDDVAIDPKKS
jgi:hypothetical protein